MRKLAPLLLALIAALAFAAALAEDGDFRFIEYDDGTAVLQHYYGAEEVVTLPAEHNGHRVIAVAPLAFYNADTGAAGIRKIIVEPGIEELETHCFSTCKDLEAVELPGTVRVIGGGAFEYCSKLKSVTLSEGLERIEARAFNDCRALESIAIPDSVCYIGWSAFSQSGIQEVRIGSQYVEIEDNPMAETPWFESRKDDEWIILGSMLLGYNGSTSELVIPSGLKSVCYDFISDEERGACVESVTFGPDMRCVADSAFAHCENIAAINGGENLERVGKDSFYGLSENRFADANGVTIIGKVLVKYAGNGERYAVPEGIVSITAKAFKDCESLEAVELPKSLRHIGDEAFWNCKGLRAITLPAGLETIDDNPFVNSGATLSGALTSYSERFIVQDGVLYDAERETVVACLRGDSAYLIAPAYAKAIAPYAYYFCVDCAAVELPEGLRRIGDEAFGQDRSLRAVTIPDSVYLLGSKAFEGCRMLQRVEVGSGVTEIGYNSPFSEARGITEAVVGPNVVWMNSAAFRSETLTIYGAPGSYAQRFATNEGYDFVATMEAVTTSAVRQPRDGYERDEDYYVYGGGFRFYVAPYMEGVADDDGSMTYWCEDGDSAAFMRFSVEELGVTYNAFETSLNYGMADAQTLVDQYAKNPDSVQLYPLDVADVNVRVPGYRGYFYCDYETDAGTFGALVILNGYYDQETGCLVKVVAVQTDNCRYDYRTDFQKVLESIAFDGDQADYSQQVWDLIGEYNACYQQIKERIQSDGSVDDDQTLRLAAKLALLYDQIKDVSTALLDDETRIYYEQTLANMETDALLTAIFSLLQ